MILIKLLEQKILSEGKVYDGDILKVDCFLNHRIDVSFLREAGKEFYRLYGDCSINKILTIEASGIGVACIAAQFFGDNVPVVFAKKSATKNLSANVYTSQVESYTHGRSYDILVSKDYLTSNDTVLLIDDFLAKGSALEALLDVCGQAGAKVAGAGIVIEKAYQGGGDKIRNRGIRVESLAKIASMSVGEGIKFC